MTKDVLITIRGVHTMDEEDNDVEMIVRGDYYQKNGKHYVLYEELLEGFKEPVKNIIKITPTSMDITKKGTATTHMLFEKNRKNISCYSTPLGEMVVGIQANHFAVDEQADRRESTSSKQKTAAPIREPAVFLRPILCIFTESCEKSLFLWRSWNGTSADTLDLGDVDTA